MPFVADTIADEAPDVVFIQEVTTSDGGEKAMEELTDELNTMMKSREPDVWINDEAVHLPPKFKMKGEDRVQVEAFRRIERRPRRGEVRLRVEQKQIQAGARCAVSQG